MELKVKRLSSTAKLPKKNNLSDAGFDIFSDEEYCIVRDGKVETVSTGLAIEIPEGYYGRLTGRSGLSIKTPLRVIEGVIDSGYRGELKIMCELYPLKNYYDNNLEIGYEFFRGDKIAQLIIQPLPSFEVIEVDELTKSDRGDKGFGSAGR